MLFRSVSLLQYDPRPAYQADHGQKQFFALRLYDFDLKWRMEGEVAVVHALEPVPGPVAG